MEHYDYCNKTQVWQKSRRMLISYIFEDSLSVMWKFQHQNTAQFGLLSWLIEIVFKTGQVRRPTFVNPNLRKTVFHKSRIVARLYKQF